MFKSIVVPVDIAHESSGEYSLPEALQIAGASGGAVALVTVVQAVRLVLDGVAVPSEMKKLVADAEARLAGIAATFRQQGPVIDREVRVGLIGQEILAAAQDRGADLILMASHRPEMRDYLIGPNAAHVARHAACSVLVLRKFARPRA